MFYKGREVISDQFHPLKFFWFWVSLHRYEKKQSVLGILPLRGEGRVRLNPKTFVISPSHFSHAKFILRCWNMFSIQGEVISDQFYPLKFIWFWVSLHHYGKVLGILPLRGGVALFPKVNVKIFTFLWIFPIMRGEGWPESQNFCNFAKLFLAWNLHFAELISSRGWGTTFDLRKAEISETH